MPTYCLSCELTPENSDLAQAAWYGHSGLLGCQEETVGDKARLKCYFKDLFSLHTAEYVLMDLCPSIPLSITLVKYQDWNTAWKKQCNPCV